MDFTDIKSIEIPEGNVKLIKKGTQTLWEKQASTGTMTINGTINTSVVSIPTFNDLKTQIAEYQGIEVGAIASITKMEYEIKTVALPTTGFTSYNVRATYPGSSSSLATATVYSGATATLRFTKTNVTNYTTRIDISYKKSSASSYTAGPNVDTATVAVTYTYYD